MTDVNGDGVVGATVVFDGPSPSDRRTVVTNDSGFLNSTISIREHPITLRSVPLDSRTGPRPT